MAEDVDAQAAKVLLRQGVVPLDVRTPGEYDEWHMEGAVNIDMLAPDFYDRICRLNKTKKYLVYCRSSSRSRRILHLFEKVGFDVYHLAGGLIGF